MGAATVHALPTGRAFFADESQETFLRATWHLDRGFVNLSIWREAVCVATFQLPVRDTARLAGFLVEGLAEAAAAGLDRPPPPPPVAPVRAVPSVTADVRQRLSTVVTEARERLAAWLHPGDAD